MEPKEKLIDDNLGLLSQDQSSLPSISEDNIMPKEPK